MKNILIVSNSFYPEISPRSFRATELAKELARQGYKVKVITHAREGLEDFCKLNGLEFKDLGQLIWPAFKVKGSGIIKLFRRVLARFSGLLFEYPMIQLVPLIKKALEIEKNYDLLISIAVPYPTHWGVALALSKNKNLTKVWIADCGDPYMGQENDTFKPPFYFGWVEKWFCKKANYLTVPTQASIKAYYPEFHAKIKIIPQGFKFEDIKTAPMRHPESLVKFGYGGMFIPGRRDPTEFLQYLNSLSDINFECIIYTTTPQFVQELANNSNGKIIVLPPINRADLLYELSQMDFVLNFENAGTAQTPSKLIDYAIINKPILSIKTGNLNKLAVDEFLQKNYSKELKIENPEQYKIENIAQKFVDLTTL